MSTDKKIVEFLKNVMEQCQGIKKNNCLSIKENV